MKVSYIIAILHAVFLLSTVIKNTTYLYSSIAAYSSHILASSLLHDASHQLLLVWDPQFWRKLLARRLSSQPQPRHPESSSEERIACHPLVEVPGSTVESRLIRCLNAVGKMIKLNNKIIFL